ncbi:NUDIX domain-containing protein [Nonomuraea wenchangensis]|uniref:NUDIX domain-containing protein n=1 Tax=Nonomuraea wenchangensis TaxID=568860 RepID=A0A1I0L2L0_9ACTN|nr:NUDIX hydrolase [Nonomuraea wenchangensis]SEU33609.1 NUDIX domain-containing protein [Nonomuraea wenchangensis]
MKALSVLAVTAVVRRDAEVLMVRQRNAGDPAPVWDLPGGMVETGEFPEAVVRLSANGAAHVREPAVACLTRPGAEVTFWRWPGGRK